MIISYEEFLAQAAKNSNADKDILVRLANAFIDYNKDTFSGNSPVNKRPLSQNDVFFQLTNTGIQVSFIDKSETNNFVESKDIKCHEFFSMIKHLSH